MKLSLCLSLLILIAICGCESEVRRRASEITAIMNQAKQRAESPDALHRLEPYLNDDSAFVRRWACQVLGEIYEGTQNDEIASQCASIFLDRMDEHLHGHDIVTKQAVRSLLKIGLPLNYPHTEHIEGKLRVAIKCPSNAKFDAIDALAVIAKPDDATRDALVEVLHDADKSDGELWWKSSMRRHSATALARFGSRTSIALPDLKKALEETPTEEISARDDIFAAIKAIEEAVAKDGANAGN